MANTSKYAYSEDTPVHEITGYHVNEKAEGKDKGILVFGTKRVQGLTPFGPQGGVLTEDSLTDAIVEFLMGKTEADGKTKTYEKYLIKKESKKA